MKTHTTKPNFSDNNYFFVDESGDPTFFDRRGNLIVGKESCSPILIIGFVKISNPPEVRKELAKLHKEIKNDEYLKAIPSIQKTNLHFHAKDDCAEVREKVFRLIKQLDFKAEFIVARKRLDVFTKRHKRDENIFYNEIVARLFERKLHQNHNVIYFSKRGTQTKQHHFYQAIQSAVLNFETKYSKQIETETKIYIQTPSDEPCLQIVDYLNWVIYRAYTKKEMRYFEFIKEKISFICDIYDFEKYPKNFYNKSNIFDINKMSPLGLESN